MYIYPYIFARLLPEYCSEKQIAVTNDIFFTVLTARLPSYHTLANIAHQTLVNLSENKLLFFFVVAFPFITEEAKYLLKCLSTIYNFLMKLAPFLNKNRMTL